VTDARGYKDSWVGDPDRNEKVAYNRAFRSKRIALHNAHMLGKHHNEPTDDCIICELEHESATKLPPNM
jgi:hypothetical protein